MKRKKNENPMMHCLNCGGEYDPSLPNCPHCGEDTERNTEATDPIPVTAYGGGFGPSGSALSKAALAIIILLIVILIAAVVSLGSTALSLFKGTFTPGDEAPTSSQTDTPDTSGEAAPDGSASSQGGDQSTEEETPPVNETQPLTPDKQPIVSPDSIELYYEFRGERYDDVTLMTVEDSCVLTLDINPADWEGNVTWTTSDKSIATVGIDGTVTNQGRGTATVTALAGTKKASVTFFCKGSAPTGEKGAASVLSRYKNGAFTSATDAAPAETQPDADAQKQAEEEEAERKRQEEEAERQRQEEEEEAERQRKEEEEAERKRQEEEERKKQEEEEKKKQESSGTLTTEYTDITLNKVGHTYTFKMKGGNGTYKWKSANPSVASVSQDGTVTAKGKGKTTLTVTSGDQSLTIPVYVK